MVHQGTREGIQGGASAQARTRSQEMIRTIRCVLTWLCEEWEESVIFGLMLVAVAFNAPWLAGCALIWRITCNSCP